MKQYYFFLFLPLVLGSYLGLHYYTSWWLARAFLLIPASARIVRLIILLCAIIPPLTMYLHHHHNGPVISALSSLSMAWTGIIFLSAMFFIASDSIVLLYKVFLHIPVPKTYYQTSLLLLTGLICLAFYNGAIKPPIKEFTLPIPGLPQELEGIRIAQIADVHLDSDGKLNKFRDIVERINKQKPDLVLITGDLLDPGLSEKLLTQNTINNFSAKLGVYGVLGNHEYYFGYEKAKACYKALGIRLIHNEAIKAGPLTIIGLGDIQTEAISKENAIRIFQSASPKDFKVYLTHHPLFFDLAAENGIALGLAGHTHKGQIFPFHFFSRMVYKYFYGIYQINQSVFYVSSGAGSWGPPMRLFADSEIPLFTLIKKN